jgi:cytochrome oxidase Cu insertion factor (SCO1/SenC/PrrC family)
LKEEAIMGLYRIKRGISAWKPGTAVAAALILIAAGWMAVRSPLVALAHEGEEEATEAAPPEEGGSPFMFLGEGDVAPDFTLTDQNHKEISLSQFKGKPVILIVTYMSCPDACPLILQSRKRLVKEVGSGDDTIFLAVDMDPVNDTPEVLKAYIEKTGMDEKNLHLLTGDLDVIDKTLKAYHVDVSREPETGKIATHTLVGYAIDSDGIVSQTIMFNFPSS